MEAIGYPLVPEVGLGFTFNPALDSCSMRCILISYLLTSQKFVSSPNFR